MKTDTDLHYPNEVFDDHLEMAIEFAITWLKDGDCQDLMPHLVAVTLDEQSRPHLTLMALAVDFNAQTKYGTLFGLGADFASKLANGERLAAVFGISEAWLVIAQPGQEKPTGDFSKHPDRQEIISVAGATCEMVTRLNGARIDIGRNAQGGMVAGEVTRVSAGDMDRRIGHNNLLLAFIIGYKAYQDGRAQSPFGDSEQARP